MTRHLRDVLSWPGRGVVCNRSESIYRSCAEGTTSGFPTDMCMLSNAMVRSGRPASTLASAACSSPPSSSLPPGTTRIFPLSRTLACMSSAYCSSSGRRCVRPLKLGRLIFMRGPAAPAAAGIPTAHTHSPPECIATAARSGSASPDSFSLRRCRHHRCRGLWATPRSSNWAKADGSPQVASPCRTAGLLLTYTRDAHAQLVGGFHTNPPSTTISSKAPSGLSSYRARYTPPSV
mmetsp:Transcript_29865/g.97261  ORF Transcript_29865/g.97261 Transcript_29865/m.97261 type:complete len:234 (-) Transcript_29865:153-854(-)